MAATTPHNNPAHIPSDRRDYFRISDHIGLEIRKLDSDDASRDNPFNGSHMETLRSEYRRLDQDVRAQLTTLAERDRLLTSLIKSLNGKLDTLARIMAFEQNPLQPEDWQDVTLSEGGLAFHAATNSFVADEILALRMTLPPELYQPIAIARVVSVEPDGSGGATVHTEFTDIHDSDRQQIARHVMRWQVRQRQKE
ncbi:PilZ domain-containing protein [Marinobacter sp. TBZ242]|uniref:PilZ domain-containing protein n=1 Tax=Marinobacter azerbaijanicus TaxID=3050455 RepID=A0ABT7I6T9_9GAMM|nr:PilZ domain-containing protein [Marinobacter sp. TBZ242]MDL0429834.1 PilZ domain-containing protein [Marinobacter sp. TBZ242]